MEIPRLSSAWQISLLTGGSYELQRADRAIDVSQWKDQSSVAIDFAKRETSSKHAQLIWLYALSDEVRMIRQRRRCGFPDFVRASRGLRASLCVCLVANTPHTLHPRLECAFFIWR